MHGIHHSIVPDEAGSNWSSGLAIWDWLHGTIAAAVIGTRAARRALDAQLQEPGTGSRTQQSYPETG